jgi:NTP pyrophosphatase (non-canonical NTP hydrolase)
MELGFNELRAANLQRCRQFRNGQGDLCHPNGVDDWDSSKWLQAFIGEVGELANILKKVERGDITLEESMPSIEKEYADSMIYLDLWAARNGVNLARAVVDKFNEVSRRVKSDVMLQQYHADYAVNLGREAYESYCGQTGWKSLATGAELPQWYDLRDDIRQAWMVSAAWVVGRVMRLNGLDKLEPIVPGT